MSPIRPVRCAPTAASRAPSPVSELRWRGVHRVEVERLVLDAGHLPAAGGQVAPADDLAGGRGGRLVEVAGRRGPPVDQQLGLLVVGEPEPADVAAGAVAQVDPAEGQPVLDGLQLGQPLLVQGGEGVALGPVLVGADRAGPAYGGKLGGRAGPQRVQARVQPVDVRLLGGDLVLGHAV